MNVKQWHGGKIGLVWGAILAVFIVFRSASRLNMFNRGIIGMTEPAFLVFSVLFLAASWITWTWLSSREARSTRDDDGV